MKTITMIGPFTDEDLAFLMTALRFCERRQPEADFAITVQSTEDIPVGQMKEFILNSFPAVKGVPVDIETFERK